MARIVPSTPMLSTINPMYDSESCMVVCAPVAGSANGSRRALQCRFVRCDICTAPGCLGSWPSNDDICGAERATKNRIWILAFARFIFSTKMCRQKPSLQRMIYDCVDSWSLSECKSQQRLPLRSCLRARLSERHTSLHTYNLRTFAVRARERKTEREWLERMFVFCRGSHSTIGKQPLWSLFST